MAHSNDLVKRFDAEQTAARLPWPALVDGLAAMMRRKRDGLTSSPDRLVLTLPYGVLLAMPASDGQFVSTKIVTVHPDNGGHGLPSVQSEVSLRQADTGRKMAEMDGQVVTGRRTAAVSLLALRTLMPTTPESALIVGAGAQARIHLHALAEGAGISTFQVVSRSEGSRQALVEYATRHGWRATAPTDADQAVADSRLIVLATTSLQAVIADRVRDDALVIAVGAYRPDMCELPSSLVRRARVVVDDPAGARHEAGDLIQADVDWVAVQGLETLIDRPDAASDLTRPTVFKSVGQALWDLAACRLVIGQ